MWSHCCPVSCTALEPGSVSRWLHSKRVVFHMCFIADCAEQSLHHMLMLGLLGHEA